MKAYVKEAIRRAETAARNHPGRTITRVAVRDSENGIGYDICSREFYEEGCCESEWLGEAYAICENGKVSSDFVTQ
ncbi:hypothetical protein RXR60_28095 [Pseudomonas aeruginosa]|nr:hypothetical protein [Pseudomonas aeruginosa]